MLRRLLVGESPSQKISVFPRPRGEFDTKRQSVRIETARNDDCGHTNRIRPACLRMGSLALPATRLRNRLVVGRHLKSWIHKAIQPKPLQRTLVRGKRFPLWGEIETLGGGILFEDPQRGVDEK